MRYLIVGIDPGNTIGIAVLGLDGRKISLQSISGGMEDAIGIIEGIGTPSIIATDVYPAPAGVLRIASSFNAKLFVPRGNVREEMKKEIAKGAGVVNSHERDAYCAAVLACRANANKIRQIFSLPDFSLEEREGLAHLALNGYTLKNAIFSLNAQKKNNETQKAHEEAGDNAPVPAAHKFDSKFSQLSNLTVAAFGELRSPQKLQSEVASLSRENAHLRKLVQMLEQQKQALLLQVRKMGNAAHAQMMRDKEVRNLKYQVKVLGEIIQKMRNGGKKWGGKKADAGEKMGKGSAKDAEKTAAAGSASSSQSKGIKGLQENREEEGLDMEKIISEYRSKRQTQEHGGV